MILALAMALQVQAGVLPKASPQSRVDSIAAAKVINRAVKAEAVFLRNWQNESLKNFGFARGLRYFSVHCHFDDLPDNDLQLIEAFQSKKSMCPIWYEQGERERESVWIDNGLLPRSRERVGQKRAEVMRLLDSAAVLAPRHPWVIAQRVRLHVDQRQYDRAARIVAEDCKLSEAFCALLQGFVIASSGNRRGAEAVFAYAHQAMNAKDRCTYLNISVFLYGKDRDAYDKLPCDAKRPIDERYWWLSDPLFMQQGNERLAVHLFRQILIMLHAGLAADEHFDWRPQFGGVATREMLLRYGWPDGSFFDPRENESHYSWLGFRDSSVNVSREYFRPRYHTTPDISLAGGISTLERSHTADLSARWLAEASTWDQDWWPIEHFAREAPLFNLDYQVAQFRREKGPFIALATDPRSSWIPDTALSRYTAALVAASGPTDPLREADAPIEIRPTGATIVTMRGKQGPQVMSAEVLDTDRDSSAAARARFFITGLMPITDIVKGEIGLSDPVLFAVSSPDSLPRGGTPDAIERMLPSTDLRRRERVGVFVELYGIASGEPVELTLSVVAVDQPGLLRRLGAKVGVMDPGGGAVVISWRQDQPGTAISTSVIGSIPVQSRSIVLNLAQFKPGHYLLEVGAGQPGVAPIVSRREFTILK